MTVPRAPITIGITVQQLSNSLARSRYLSFCSLSFYFILRLTRTSKSTIWQVFFIIFLLVIIIKSGRLSEVRWFVCIYIFFLIFKCVSLSRRDSVRYNLFVWPDFSFMYNSLWVNLHTHSCLVLYFFFANLLNSLIMWWIISSLSPHKIHLLFSRLLFILALIWLILVSFFVL